MTNYQKSDPKTIQAMFNSIATTYDRTNAVLSFRLHHHWNKALIAGISQHLLPDSPLLDLCCGTGEIGLNLLKSSKNQKHLYMLDFSKQMLECAKSKASSVDLDSLHKIAFLQADAQAIPLPPSSIAAATIAYGIRNVKDPALCIQDVYRVLKPGGVFGILELTRPINPVLRFGHHVYLRTLLPAMGWCFSANQEAYEYLCNSIHSFVEPDELERLLIKSGFRDVTQKRLSGGIATILFAKKPF